MFVLAAALIHCSTSAALLSPRDYTRGQCKVQVVLTLDLTPGELQNTIYMLSWVQDAKSMNAAVSSVDASLPYGTIAWSKTASKADIHSVIAYQGMLDDGVRVSYIEKGREQGKDYTKFNVGSTKFTSKESNCNTASPHASWSEYRGKREGSFWTRQVWCTFDC